MRRSSDRAHGGTHARETTTQATGWRARRKQPARAWCALAGMAAVLLAVICGGCGESVELPDLFVVQRIGATPKLTVVVNEGGGVRCDGGPVHQLSDAQLVQARGLQEELQSPSAKHLALSPRPGSVFSYSVRDAEGTVRFSDNSAGQTPVLRHLAYFVVEVQQKVCHSAG